MERRRPIRAQVQSVFGIAVAVVLVLVVLTLLYPISRLFDVTFMNLLKALAVPITVGVAVPWLNWLQKKRELDVENQSAQDAALQAYLDQMGSLLLDKESRLRQSNEGAEVRTLARARTLTALARLDGSRKRNVMQFLYEADLITGDHPVISLSMADLIGADLMGATLSGANLVEANLYRANLDSADLRGADLTGTYLGQANLKYADLTAATMSDHHLSPHGAETRVDEANLFGAKLSGQILVSMSSAIMPDGQKGEDWFKSEGSGEAK